MTETNRDNESQEEKKAKKEGRIRKKAKKAVGWDSIKESTDTNKNLYDIAFKEKKRKSPIRHESFAQACERMQLTESDIIAARIREKRSFYTTFAAMIALIIYFIYMLITATEGINFFSAFVTLGPASIMGVLSFRSSFRNWQIRNRTLGGLAKFRESSSNWWPR